MQEKRNDATINRPYGERMIDGPMVKIDLHAYEQQLKYEDAWRKNDRNAITVYKTENVHIVLVAMHKGAELLPQVSEGVMSVQVLEGYINVIVSDGKNPLRPGNMIALHEGIGYNIVALEESTFLLTICGLRKGENSIH